MKGIWKTKSAEEEYIVNTAPEKPDHCAIRIQTFCHSLFLPHKRLSGHPHPLMMCSMILNGNCEIISGDGDRQKQGPGFFSIHDLNLRHNNQAQNKDILERYFILFEVTPLLNSILAQLFPGGLPNFQTKKPERLRRCFEEIRNTMQKGRIDDIQLGAMGFKLLLEAAEQMPREPVPGTLLMALRYIDNHFSEPELDRTRIAMASGISKSMLGKLFRAKLNTTVLGYIRQQRMEKAKRLLSSSLEPVAMIAQKCGFPYGAYFARQFFQYTGQTPLEFRKSEIIKNTEKTAHPFEDVP
ncbi:MAG: helix-turn-helix transcriptional regulator [Lentisphaeria bacterium]|nr:helix-turn-helix transcriptional regulator [Lentisphaeria bacterium]